MGNKKGRPQWGRPRAIGLSQALYQGAGLSARGSVLLCANAHAATADVRLRVAGAWLQAVWMEAFFIAGTSPDRGQV